MAVVDQNWKMIMNNVLELKFAYYTEREENRGSDRVIEYKNV